MFRDDAPSARELALIAMTELEGRLLAEIARLRGLSLEQVMVMYLPNQTQEVDHAQKDIAVAQGPRQKDHPDTDPHRDPHRRRCELPAAQAGRPAPEPAPVLPVPR